MHKLVEVNVLIKLTRIVKLMYIFDKSTSKKIIFVFKKTTNILKMLIVYINPGPGWEPITEMVNLATELFDAELMVIDDKPPNFLAKLELFFLKRHKLKNAETCLLVFPGPTVLLSLLSVQNWRKRFSFVAVWVIDSFWVEHIPKIAKLTRPFDHIFITSEEDVEMWTRSMKTPTTWLAWGSDVLRLGGNDLKRTWDLTRIGRQPPEWDDDDNTKKLCINSNLEFHGRLKGYDTAAKNQEMLMNLYRQTKFLLAFSNTANPTNYTHPTREYITARWTDALACGAIVAGIPPREPSINRLLWDGATLDLKSVRIDDGLRIISEAARSWKPQLAAKNHQLALERLDWRWRFAEIALVFNESPKRLSDELKVLKKKIAEFKS